MGGYRRVRTQRQRPAEADEHERHQQPASGQYAHRHDARHARRNANPRQRGAPRPFVRDAAQVSTRRGHQVWQRHAANAMELPRQEARPSAHLRPVGVEGGIGADPAQHRPRRRHVQKRALALIQRVFLGEVAGEQCRAEQQRQHAEPHVAAAQRGDAHRPQPPARTSRATPHRRQLDAKPDQDERQQQGVDVPTEQQRRARLGEQLPEPPRLHEHHHAVEHQQHREQVDADLGGDDVVVVQHVLRGERKQRRAQGHPPIAEEANDRQVRQYRGGAEERQHQHPRRHDLRGKIVRERRNGEPQQHEAAKGKTVVQLMAQRAVVPPRGLQERDPPRQRQVRRQGHVLGGHLAVNKGPVKVIPIAQPGEHRTEREEQARKRQPAAMGATGHALPRGRSLAFLHGCSALSRSAPSGDHASDVATVRAASRPCQTA